MSTTAWLLHFFPSSRLGHATVILLSSFLLEEIFCGRIARGAR